MIKYLFIALFLVLAVLLSGGLLRVLPQATLTSSPTRSVQISPETPHARSEFTIAELQRRKYVSAIEVVRTIQETPTYVSHLVSYQSDGLKLYALLMTPKGQIPDGGWPVVVVNHGYIPPEVYSTEQSYINTSTYYAQAGFAVLKPDYRGHDLSQGEAGTLRSRISYAVDVLNLLAGLPSLKKLNSQQVFMYGHSMGGDVTLRVVEVCGDCVKAASLWAPAVTSWPETVLYFSRKNDPDRLARLQAQLSTGFNEADYDKISTFENLSFVNIPLLLHHGTADESVPYAWGQALQARLVQQNKSVVFYSYPNDTHDIPKNWGVALKRDVEFFKQHLR